MKTQKGVEDAFYKSKEDAMIEFKERWGENGYLLDSLQENPLPDSVVIMIADLETADSLARVRLDSLANRPAEAEPVIDDGLFPDEETVEDEFFQ